MDEFIITKNKDRCPIRIHCMLFNAALLKRNKKLSTANALALGGLYNIKLLQS